MKIKTVKCIRCDNIVSYTNQKNVCGRNKWAIFGSLAYCPDHYQFRFSLGDRDYYSGSDCPEYGKTLHVKNVSEPIWESIEKKNSIFDGTDNSL